jgi:F-type H+-transporting ATPase subunit gamma
MEMVATAKSKRAQSRVVANTPYSEKLTELLESLSAAGSVNHYLLGNLEEQRGGEGAQRNALLVVTANRGLCGGYNTNVLGMAQRWIDEEKESGRETDISMIGKKGITRFRFWRVPLKEAHTHIEDRPSFREAEAIAQGFMARFRAGEVERVLVISTRYYSAGVQKPVLVQLLPIAPPGMETAAPGGAGGRPEPPGSGDQKTFLFEPDPGRILDALLPFSVSNVVYRLLIEAAASEQIARRVAMKLATDNAEEVIRSYTRMYNRQRQAGITQQLTEIVGGADALG